MSGIHIHQNIICSPERKTSLVSCWQKQVRKFTEMLVCFFPLHLKVKGWQLQWSDDGSSSCGWWWAGVPTRNQPRLPASLCFRQEVKMSGNGKKLKTQRHSWSNDLGGIRKLKVGEFRHGECDGGGQREHIDLSVQLRESEAPATLTPLSFVYFFPSLFLFPSLSLLTQGLSPSLCLSWWRYLPNVWSKAQPVRRSGSDLLRA